MQNERGASTGRGRQESVLRWLNGQTASQAIDLMSAAWGSFQLPAVFTGVGVSVEFSNDRTNWTAVPIEGNEPATITVVANGTYSLPMKTPSAKFARLVGDAQAAEREVAIFLRG